MTIVRDGFVTVLQPRRPDAVGNSEGSAAWAELFPFSAPPGNRNGESMVMLEAIIALRRHTDVKATGSLIVFVSSDVTSDASLDDFVWPLVC